MPPLGSSTAEDKPGTVYLTEGCALPPDNNSADPVTIRFSGVKPDSLAGVMRSDENMAGNKAETHVC